MLAENTAPPGKARGRLVSVELCAGGGGLALGLERAGFTPALLLDTSSTACETLRINRPDWNVLHMDVHDFAPGNQPQVHDVDLLAGGLPRLRSTATSQRMGGNEKELKVLWETLRITDDMRPRALLIENIPALLNKKSYASVREDLRDVLNRLGYSYHWFVLNAADHRVPQHREHGFVVAFRDGGVNAFQLPLPVSRGSAPTVGEALGASMAKHGWAQAARWAAQATEVAPTLVGGSTEHGGADLGPTGTKRAWERMGVNGASLADTEPGPDFHWDPDLGRPGMVRLTTGQAALLQGFPSDWSFAGKKTIRYQQIGSACPPPVGEALGVAVRTALESG